MLDESYFEDLHLLKLMWQVGAHIPEEDPRLFFDFLVVQTSFELWVLYNSDYDSLRPEYHPI